MASKVRQKLLKLWWWFRVGVFHCRQYIMQIVLTVQILLLILFLIKRTLLAIDPDCLPKVRYLKLKNSDNLSPVKPLPQVSKLPSVWFLIQTKISRLLISLQSCWKSYLWLPPPVPDILIWQQIIFPHLLAQNFHSLFLGPCARQVKSNWLYVIQSNRFCSTFLHKEYRTSVCEHGKG